MRSLVMCTTCRFSPESREGPDGRTGGQVLIAHVKDAIAARNADLEVVEQACLWNCNRPCSVIFRDDERFTYIAGGHAPEREQADAILDWFAMHGETPTGEVPFRQWPNRMRGHFIARIPPVKR
jgi:predicted metal-binding protein